MFRFRSGGPLAVAAFIGAVLAFKFLGPELISQLCHVPSTDQSSAPHSDESWGGGNDYARYGANQQDPSGAASGDHDSDSGWPSADQIMLPVAVLLGVVVVAVLAWAGLRIYARHGRSSDPMKYVMSDPWVRAKLASEGLPPDRSPEA